jgi:hypothetical protein
MAKKKRQKQSRKKTARLSTGMYVDWALDEAERLVAVDEVEHRLAIEQSDGTFAFFGRKGPGPGQFHYPRSIEILNGVAYVVDSWNHRVQMFELPAWSFKGTFGKDGDPIGQLFCPSSITIAHREKETPWLLVADTNNDRLSFYDTAGRYLFESELLQSRHPVKVQTRNQSIEVQYEDGQWERLT